MFGVLVCDGCGNLVLLGFMIMVVKLMDWFCCEVYVFVGVFSFC